MKKNLFSLCVIFTLALFSHLGLSADLALPPPAAGADLVAAGPEMLALSPAAKAPPLQFAAIGDGRDLRNAGLTAPEPADKATTESLPSTPIALAALLLVICILVGRRNT